MNIFDCLPLNGLNEELLWIVVVAVAAHAFHLADCHAH